MQIKWVWFVVSPLLKILLNKFWQWVINTKTVSAIALSLKIQILVILLVIYLELLLKTASTENLNLFTDERQR
ncbi:MAG: hypothetical protein QNJ34_14075 [Xenococcaceae cyanobacterium MO_188.B29]|nr:hypothetical protein [Xenococcaceae cyanobacterium MO_188.B29]